MPLTHRGIKTVLCNSDPLTQYRGLECERSKVALHLLNVVLAQELQIFNAAVFTVIDRDGAHLIEVSVKASEIAFEIWRHRLPGSVKGADALFGAPYLIHRSLNGLDKFHVHFVAVVQEPRTFLRLRHITQYHN